MQANLQFFQSGPVPEPAFWHCDQCEYYLYLAVPNPRQVKELLIKCPKCNGRLQYWPESIEPLNLGKKS